MSGFLSRVLLRRAGAATKIVRTTANVSRIASTRWSSSSSSSSSEEEEARPEPAQADNMTDIGVRHIFTSEHDIFREQCRKFFREQCAPQVDKWEADGQVSREIWQAAGEQGILGIDTSAENGGIGGDFLTSVIPMEEQMYVNCSSLGFALHSHIVMPYISHYGSKEQIQKFLPDMTAGKKIGAIAMTEPGAGSDLQGVKTTAKKDGDDYILNGSKVFITNGYMSDLVIVVAITDNKAKSMAHGLSLFVVEEGMKGFKKGKKLKKMGLKGQDTAELFFEDVRLPKSALLGEQNHGFYYLMQELPQERLLIGIIAQASMEFMFEETRRYVRERKAFGKTLADLQTVQHELASIKTEICVLRAFTDRCIQLHSQGRLDPVMASMNKYWISDVQNKIAYRCVQLHGGWGYMMEYPICRSYLDARVNPIYGGANEIMRELIARPIVRG